MCDRHGCRYGHLGLNKRQKLFSQRAHSLVWAGDYKQETRSLPTEEIRVCGRVGWRQPARNEDFSSEWSPLHLTRTGEEARAGRQKRRPGVGTGVACWRPEGRLPLLTLSESDGYSANNCMNLEAGPSPVKVQMRPQPQRTARLLPRETLSSVRASILIRRKQRSKCMF